MNSRWRIPAIAACIAGCPHAHAQVVDSITGQVNAQLVLTSGCSIDSGGGSATTGTNFGTLNFGTQPAGFTGKLNAQLAGAGSGGATQVTCSSDVQAITVTIDGGQHASRGSANGVGSRAMSNGTDYVPYELYADAGASTGYVAGTATNVPIPTPGQPFDLPIYGLVDKTSAVALSTGTYTDTLNVTLGW